MAKSISLFCIVAWLFFPFSADAGEQPADTVLSVFEVVDDTRPRVLTLDLTHDASDIWDRIRRGFSMPDLTSDLVDEYQIFYLNRPSFLKQVLRRGGRYLYHIVGELERRGMPMELALLPIVESSYNPFAYSHAHASGLWQFIPSTGKNYNLTQDSWVDERRDVIASTEAALDYLQAVYEMHGDWHLALASYNWGEGAVGRAIKRNLDAGQPAYYDALNMPNETRNYIPKLQAIKNIIAQPELFNLELPYVANEASFAVVAVPEGIDLAAAAEFAEMPLEEFVALNPGFNRPVITVPGRSLVVPLDRVEQFQERLAEWPADEKGWRLYKVKNGETLANIARQHHLSLTQLRELNGLTPKSKISPGYAILVPDGVDPDGALKVSRLLPRRERLAGQSNLKVSKKKAVFKGKVGRNKAVQAKKPASKKSGQASNKKAVVKKKSTNQGKNKKKRQQIL